jgi:hypothetical protein
MIVTCAASAVHIGEHRAHHSARWQYSQRLPDVLVLHLCALRCTVYYDLANYKCTLCKTISAMHRDEDADNAVVHVMFLESTVYHKLAYCRQFHSCCALWPLL